MVRIQTDIKPLFQIDIERRADMIQNNDCHNCPSGCGTEEEYKITVREQALKDNLMKRLNRAEGQVRGIKGMIDKDVYCNDVLVQIAAVQAALDSVSKLVLENHIRGCLVKRIQAGDETIVDELLVTIGKML